MRRHHRILAVVVLVIALVVMAGQLVCGNPEVVLK
jgi:hypothetical protein